VAAATTVLTACGTEKVVTDPASVAGSVSASTSADADADVDADIDADADADTDAGKATSCVVPSPSPSVTVAETVSPVGDMPPNYGDNHAYRSTARLTGENYCTGRSESERVTGALNTLRAKGGTLDPAGVAAALTGLGYPADNVRTGSYGEGRVSFTVTLTPVCLDGSVEQGGTKVEAHGAYIEGTGCVEPAGGH
jgi:hypothetical protein